MDVREHAQFLENHGKLPWKYSLQKLETILDIFYCFLFLGFYNNKLSLFLAGGHDGYQGACSVP